MGFIVILFYNHYMLLFMRINFIMLGQMLCPPTAPPFFILFAIQFLGISFETSGLRLYILYMDHIKKTG